MHKSASHWNSASSTVSRSWRERSSGGGCHSFLTWTFTIAQWSSGGKRSRVSGVSMQATGGFSNVSWARPTAAYFARRCVTGDTLSLLSSGTAVCYRVSTSPSGHSWDDLRGNRLQAHSSSSTASSHQPQSAFRSKVGGIVLLSWITFTEIPGSWVDLRVWLTFDVASPTSQHSHPPRYKHTRMGSTNHLIYQRSRGTLILMVRCRACGMSIVVSWTVGLSSRTSGQVESHESEEAAAARPTAPVQPYARAPGELRVRAVHVPTSVKMS